MANNTKFYYGSQQATFAHVQKCVKDGVPLLTISIVDPYSDKPDFGIADSDHIRLPSRFDMGLRRYVFDAEDLLPVFNVVLEHVNQKHDVVIHCTEGRLRSPSVAAEFYAHLTTNHDADISFPRSLDGRDTDGDREITRQIRGILNVA